MDNRYNSQGKGLASISAVRNWFYGNGLPYWALYSGTVVKNQSLALRNINTEDLDEAWNSLEGLLNDYSINGGTFTITVAKVNKNAGTSLPRTMVTLSRQNAYGIHGIQQNQYNPNNIQGIGLLRKTEEQIREEEREKVNMARDLEDMRNEMAGIRDENRSNLEVISGFVQSDNGAAIINHIAGLFMPQKPNISIAGVKEGNPNQAAEEVEEEEEEEGFYYGDIIPFLDRIRDKVGDSEFSGFVGRLNAMTDLELNVMVGHINSKK